MISGRCIADLPRKCAFFPQDGLFSPQAALCAPVIRGQGWPRRRGLYKLAQTRMSRRRQSRAKGSQRQKDTTMTEPVLLIPGLLCDARLWAHQLLYLSQHRPVMVVQPKGTSIEDMSAQVLAAARARFALVGLGMGGDVALDVLRRGLDRVSRIALLSTDPLQEAPAAAAAREARMVAAQSGRLWQALDLEYPPSDMGERAETVQARLREMAEFLGEGVFLTQSRVMQRRPDQQKTLRRATVPALVMGGARDRLVPVRRHEFVAKMLPFGRLKIFDGIGHLLPLEAPEAVTAALETFLRGPMLLK